MRLDTSYLKPEEDEILGLEVAADKPLDAVPEVQADAAVEASAPEQQELAKPDGMVTSDFAQKLQDLQGRIANASGETQKAKDALQRAKISDAIFAGDNLSKMLMHTDKLSNPGEEIVRNAMANVAGAEAKAQALQPKLEGLQQLDPNSAKAKALQAVLAKRGYDGTGLGAPEMGDLLTQSGLDARAAEALDTRSRLQKELIDSRHAEGDLNRATRLKAAEMAAKRKSGSGGGVAGPDLRQDAEWLNATTRGDENAKKELLAMPRKDFVAWLKGHAARSDIAPGKEEQAQLKLQQSQEKTDKGTAQAIGTWRSKARIDDDYKLLNEATTQLNNNKDLFKMYFAAKGPTKTFQDVKAFLGDSEAKEAQKAFNTLDRTLENYARDRSGAAISNKEWETFRGQLGAGKFSTPEAAIAALNRLKETIKSKDISYLAGKGGGAKMYAQEATARGIDTPWITDVAKENASSVTPKAEDRVHVINAAGRDVTLPASQVEAALASGRYTKPGAK